MTKRNRKIILALRCCTVQHLAAMKRVMVNLDETVGEKLEQKAKSEKRSSSSYVALLIENDLRQAGLIGADGESEAVILAFAKELGLSRAAKILERSARRKPSGAAAR